MDGTAGLGHLSNFQASANTNHPGCFCLGFWLPDLCSSLPNLIDPKGSHPTSLPVKWRLTFLPCERRAARRGRTVSHPQLLPPSLPPLHSCQTLVWGSFLALWGTDPGPSHPRPESCCSLAPLAVGETADSSCHGLGQGTMGDIEKAARCQAGGNKGTFDYFQPKLSGSLAFSLAAVKGNTKRYGFPPLGCCHFLPEPPSLT